MLSEHDFAQGTGAVAPRCSRCGLPAILAAGRPCQPEQIALFNDDYFAKLMAERLAGDDWRWKPEALCFAHIVVKVDPSLPPNTIVFVNADGRREKRERLAL